MTKRVEIDGFPLAYTKPKTIKQLRKIVHRLIRKKGEYLEVSVKERLEQLCDPSNGSWHKHIAALQKKGIKYNRLLRVKFDMVKIKDIFIDDDIQRELDVKHVVKIANIDRFRVEFMSPIQGTKEVGKWRFHSTNAQHTLVLEAAIAAYKLWEGYDGDWQELEVPFIYIETNDRSFARRQFDVYNGKYSKPLGPADHHKMKVLFYRVDGNLDTEYKEAAELQSICEENGYEPLYGEEDENRGHPKCISHVSAMRKYKGKPLHWEFILKTHSKYWPNIELHGMEIDLYGYMYEYFKVKQKTNVYSKSFEKEFLEPVHAIIQCLFSSPEQLSSESANTFKRWYAKTWDVNVDDADNKVEAQASFVLLMKIYRDLGGTHTLPEIVDLYDNTRAGDLTKYLSPAIKKAMNP